MFSFIITAYYTHTHIYIYTYIYTYTMAKSGMAGTVSCSSTESTVTSVQDLSHWLFAYAYNSHTMYTTAHT